MKIIKIVFVFLFCFNSCFLQTNENKTVLFASSYAENSSLEEIVDLAKQYRLNPLIPCCEEEERKKDLLTHLSHVLPIYQEESIEEAVKAFVKNNINELNNFSIMDVRETSLGGKSKDTVFLINDNNEKLLFVVKAFQNGFAHPSKFLQEISALDLIQQLEIENLNSLLPIAAAKYHDDKGEWGLLLEMPAEGRRTDQYIRELSNNDDSEQRVKVLNTIQKVFERIGQCFADFHAIKSDDLAPVPNYYLEKYEKKLQEILENSHVAEELSFFIPLDDFVNYINFVKEQVLTLQIHYTYSHGDSHLGNLFYNEENESLTMIDVAKMHRSFDIQGSPIFDGTVDLLKIEESFRKSAIGLLSAEEMDETINLFYQSYVNRSGEALNEHLILFYKTYLNMRHIVKYSRYIKEENEEIRNLEKAYFDMALQYFQKAFIHNISYKN